jgi:NAD(P)-dependent dehydrogenase (short-subunit alcohol dehydrogenase family)
MEKTAERPYDNQPIVIPVMTTSFIAPEQSFTCPTLNGQPQINYSQSSYSGSGKLTGLKALITHACSGIGRAVAIAYAREGADVLISYQQEEGAKETAQYITQAGGKAILLPGDISQEEQCKEMVKQAVKVFGRLDILVNNAAWPAASVSRDETLEEEADRTFRTNLYTMYNLCHTALPHLKSGSMIVNTTLDNVETTEPTLLSYSAEKKAIQNFTASLALLVADQGIRVNCVALDASWTSPVSPAVSSIPLAHPYTLVSQTQKPAEPAHLYVSLAAPGSDYKSGVTVSVEEMQQG